MGERNMEEGGKRDAHETLLQIENFQFQIFILQSPPPPAFHPPIGLFPIFLPIWNTGYPDFSVILRLSL
jgi:hypothetical protein